MKNRLQLKMSPAMERVARRAFNIGRVPDDPKQAIEEMMNAFGEFKQAHGGKLESMQKQLDRIDTVMNRPRFGGGSTRHVESGELNKAFRHYLLTDDVTRLNTISTTIDPDGGYLVLPERSTGFEQKMYDQSPIRRLCRTVSLTTGGAWEEPADVDDIQGDWVGELEDRNEGTTSKWGLLTVQVRECYALVPITQRMIDDSYFDIFGWCENKIADKFARMEGLAAVSGDGVKKPRGFLTYPVSADSDSTRPWATIQYVSSGSPIAITADSLLDLVFSLRAPYRAGAAWLMSSDTARIVSKLKDGNGDYLWRESLTSGTPNTLCGFPVEYSEDMPATAADAYPIAFANWKRAYVLVDKKGIRFLRDPYTAKPKVLVYAYRRIGGEVSNSEAIKLLKISI